MAYDEETDTRAKASWNFAAEQSKHIHGLITKAMNFYLKGDIANCYWTLNGVRILIHPRLDKKERKFFKSIEIVINRYIGDWEKWKRSKDEGNTRSDLKESKRKFSRLNIIYFQKIGDLLRELGFSPDKEDRTDLGF